MPKVIRAVIFDFGGVLGLPQDHARIATMASLCGLSTEKFQSVYGRDRSELDRGTLSAEEYWRRILEIGGIAADPDLIARIEREDSLGWTRINQVVVHWGAELRAARYRTAILSNMPSAKLSFMRASGSFGWIKDFQPAIFSCEYHLVKPEPEIYRLCLEKLAVDPEGCIFLDDVPRNVEAARALGIHALHFRSAAAGAAELELRWELPVSSLRNGSQGGRG
jgi:putative hydrolase of the HAD superfamily